MAGLLPVSPCSKPSRHNTASTARPNHNVVPGGGQGGTHQVLGVGRDPGEGAGEVDQERRKEQRGQEQKQEGKQEPAKQPAF